MAVVSVIDANYKLYIQPFIRVFACMSYVHVDIITIAYNQFREHAVSEMMILSRPEVNIGPWDEEFADIKRGAMAQNWSSKLPLAYWKGNPDVDSPVRTELLKCNDSQAWGAQIMRQVINLHSSLLLLPSLVPNILLFSTWPNCSEQFLRSFIAGLGRGK